MEILTIALNVLNIIVDVVLIVNVLKYMKKNK